MTPVEWRALIEAYLDGRISADAFARRFNESWLVQANAREPFPTAITNLLSAVEQFSEPEDDDDDMRQAAARALANLGESEAAPGVAPHTFDRVRAREEVRRVQWQMTGCAGLGCVIAAAWVSLCAVQIYFVSEWIQHEWGWGAWPSSLLGFFLAFTPVVGNVLAFVGATQEGWPGWLAAIVFFAAPALTMLSGWSRWRKYGP